MALYCASVMVEFEIFCDRNGPAPDVNVGHAGSPRPFGLPVAANLVHAPTIWSDRVISAPCNSRGWPLIWSKFTPRFPPCQPGNTNWMSVVWAARG